jgi:hypothetical protein
MNRTTPFRLTGASLSVIAVIASLLFSAGEGMHLTPFGFSGSLNIETRNFASSISSSTSNSLNKYGPVDVPVRLKQHGKRQTGEFIDLAHVGSNLPDLLLIRVNTAGPFKPRSNHSGPRQSGRAPPRLT